MKMILSHPPLESPCPCWPGFTTICAFSCFLELVSGCKLSRPTLFFLLSVSAGVSGPVRPNRAVFPQLPRHSQLLLLRWWLRVFPRPFTGWALPPQVPAHQRKHQNMSPRMSSLPPAWPAPVLPRKTRSTDSLSEILPNLLPPHHPSGSQWTNGPRRDWAGGSAAVTHSYCHAHTLLTQWGLKGEGMDPTGAVFFTDWMNELGTLVFLPLYINTQTFQFSSHVCTQRIFFFFFKFTIDNVTCLVIPFRWLAFQDCYLLLEECMDRCELKKQGTRRGWRIGKGLRDSFD